MGNHLMDSTSLEKTQSPVSAFCYARNRVCNAEAKTDNTSSRVNLQKYDAAIDYIFRSSTALFIEIRHE